MGISYSGSTPAGRSGCAAMIQGHIELTNLAVFAIFEPVATLTPSGQATVEAAFGDFHFRNFTCAAGLILNFEAKTCSMLYYNSSYNIYLTYKLYSQVVLCIIVNTLENSKLVKSKSKLFSTLNLVHLEREKMTGYLHCYICLKQ